MHCLFFFVRRHTSAWKHDNVMANPSVCLSHSGIVPKQMHTSSNSFHYLVEAWLLFWALPPLQISKGNSLSGSIKYTEMWKKLATLDINCRLSRKWYEIGPRLLWITNRKSQVANWSMSVPMTLSDFKRQDVRGQFSGGPPLIMLVQFDTEWTKLAR